MYNRLVPLNTSITSKRIKTADKLKFLAHFWVFINLHTRKTVTELAEEFDSITEDFKNVRKLVYEIIDSSYCHLNSDDANYIEDMFKRYGIAFDF